MLNELTYEHRSDGPVLVAGRVGGINVPWAVRFEIPVPEDDDMLLACAVTFAASFGSTEITGHDGGTIRLVARRTDRTEEA